MGGIQGHPTGEDELDPIAGAQVHEFLYHTARAQRVGSLGQSKVVKVETPDLREFEVPVGKGYDLYLLHSEKCLANVVVRLWAFVIEMS